MQIKDKNSGDNLLDFSASLNPYPPAIDWDPGTVYITEYPDDSYCELKEAIAKNFDCSPDEICVGNGSIEIIRTFFQTVLSEGDRVYTDPHTFGEYDLSIRLAGGICTHDLSSDYRVRVICNPNNPTGSIIKKEEMLSIVEEENSAGRMVFIDEAFMDLSDIDETLIGCKRPGVFISRSLTKSFSAPGIRFGFGIGDPNLIEKIEIVRTPWTVNSYAAAFSIQAMNQFGELEKSRDLILKEKEWLYKKFEELGMEYERSYANYILLKTPGNASEFTSELLKYNIFVRDCTSFGLPIHIRIAVRSRNENISLLEAIEYCLH